jgi:uncharacterized membrane protein HdeD (DUF308 family)
MLCYNVCVAGCAKILRGRMRMDRFMNVFSRAVLIAAGILCFTHSRYILVMLPYLIGISMMVAGGIIVFVSTDMVRRHVKWAEETSSRVTRSLMIIVVGIITVIKGAEALPFIGVSWGLLGLYKSAGIFEDAAEEWNVDRKVSWAELAETAVEAVLSCILLFEPVEELGTHIYLLGMQIIIFAVFRARK